MEENNLAYYINPNILKWARETAGFNKEIIAKRLKISEEELSEIEEGNKDLTIKQLRKLANYYKRPTVLFYLEKTPEDVELPDFRARKEKPIVTRSDESLNIKIRSIYEKKKNAEELVKLLNLNLDYSFIDKIQIGEKDSSKQLRSLLDIYTKDLRNLRDNEVLNYWKDRVEEKDILVFQFQRIGLNITRGFVFTPIPFPLIALNQKDTFYARVFTLIHEFCHIFLKKSGLCNADILEEDPLNTERICNKVTAEILVPENEIRQIVKENQFSDNISLIKELSNHFKVSYSVILFRLKFLELISITQYEFLKNWIEELANERSTSESSSSGGGDYYRTYFSRTSDNFLDLVFKSLHSEKIQYHDAIKYLGEKRSTFDEIHKRYTEDKFKR